MKNLLFFVTTAVLFFSACQKENITPVDFNEINDTDTITHTDTAIHVYDTVQHTVDTPQVHISVTDVLSRAYAVAFTNPVSSAFADDRAMGFEITFTLQADGEIYFAKDQLRELIGIADSMYTNHGIHSFISGNYVIDNSGLYKIQKNQPQYITLSMVVSRDTSAVKVPVAMSVPVFDYRVKNNNQFKAQTVAIGLKTDDVMF